jgi:hypothetical protein
MAPKIDREGMEEFARMAKWKAGSAVVRAIVVWTVLVGGFGMLVSYLAAAVSQNGMPLLAFGLPSVVVGILVGIEAGLRHARDIKLHANTLLVLLEIDGKISRTDDATRAA